MTNITENINKIDIQNKNPWWLNPKIKITEKQWMHRDLFFALQKAIDLPMILNVVGLRRTGKSTILKQLIADLLGKNIKSKNIFYYLFDKDSYVSSAANLEKILEYYLAEILETKIFEIKDRVFVFLDEIQYISSWQSVLKKYYDLSGKKIKFIVTGSQSILLREKSSETLAGRIFDYYLPPLSFAEFLQIKKTAKSLTKQKQIDLFKSERHFKYLEDLNYQYGSKLRHYCQEYILFGQFPENLSIKDEELKNIYLQKSVIGKVIKDILTIYEIEKKENFELVANYLLKNSANLLELKNVGAEVGLSFVSLDKYFNFLQSGYLLKVLYKKHRTPIKQGRILKKVYATSSNFVSALQNYRLKHFTDIPQVFGHIIETAVFNFLDRNYSDDFLPNKISFWRKGEKEIDFIVKNKNEQELPVEVKFVQAINYKELKPLVNYIAEQKIDFGLVVTKEDLSRRIINNQLVFFIPYYLFLLG